ncbi:MAG: Mov34/MPN/PAD-1 family protein [Abditibacteriales bacterium]|nr:Mov34/MPN/PAD-1 family protein [Abditibacteriales bacterium]MDW8364798.1 Mov34/MPN/PAD-1 family protein [Abditibacteriales bacterium]
MDNPSVQSTALDAPPSLGDGEPLMEFGEVEVRPLEKRVEPSRDRSLATQTVGMVSPADLPIFLDKSACEDIEAHAREDTENEVGGVLLGKQYEGRNGPFVLIVKALPAKHVEHSGTHLKFTHQTWETFFREKDAIAPELDIVGWYHTHPGLTVFMSSYDRFIHDHFFSRPQDVALVVDPLANDRGFFHWDLSNGRKLRRCTGFHLVAPRHERVALQQLVQALQTRPLSPYLTGVTTEKELEDMSRITFKDLALAVLFLVVVLQSLMMWNVSYQRTMIQEMFFALPFTEDDWIRKNSELQKEKQAWIAEKNKLAKERDAYKENKESLETKLKARERKVEALTEKVERLNADVADLKAMNNRLKREIARLGGKPPKETFWARTLTLPVALTGGLLLATIAALATAIATTRKYRQELAKLTSQKPSV